MEGIDNQSFKVKLEEDSVLIKGWDGSSEELQPLIKCEEIKNEEYEDVDIDSIIHEEVSDIGLEDIKIEEHEYINSNSDMKLVNSEQPVESNLNNRTKRVTVIHVGLKSYHCSECSFKSAYKCALTRHINAIHKKIRPFKCNKCNYKSAEKSTLTTHINSIHDGIKQFQCIECNYKTAVKSHLIKHINVIHKGIKRHQCSECDFKSAQKGNLEAHFNAIHKRLKPFQCNECDFKTAQKLNLTKHINVIHKGIKLYHCRECVYKCAQQSTLIGHIISIHGGNKLFQCIECNYKTLLKGDFTKHINVIHKRIRPYQCSKCVFKCDQKRTLTKHFNTIHKEIKPFKCNECNYRCADKRPLTKHINAIHKDIERFQCSECDFKTAHKIALTRHFKTKWFKKWIAGSDLSDQCRLCNNALETTNHILVGCNVYLQDGTYLARHNKVCQYIHWKLCKHYNIKVEEQQWKHEPQPFVNNEVVQIEYDQTILTDLRLPHNCPDITVTENKGNEVYLIEVGIPNDLRVAEFEAEKRANYVELKNELQHQTGKNVTVIPIVIGATGACKTTVQEHLKKLPAEIKVEALINEVLNGSSAILNKFLAV